MEGKPTSQVAESKPAAEKPVKVETSNDSGEGGVDLGAKIAKSFDLDTDSSEVSDEQVYRDPAPLKWRIFEVVAKTNGQRAFGTYWSALRDFMHGWLPRGELDEALHASLGAANVHLHNELILCLLHNARCRYLPVELVSQVPPSSRGKVVHATVRPPPPPPLALPGALPSSSPEAAVTAAASSSLTAPLMATSSKAALPGAASAAAVPSPFHGKKTEGLLSIAGEKAAAAASCGGREEICSNTLPPPPPPPLKIEVGGDGGKEPRGEVAAAAVKPEAKAAGGATMAPEVPPLTVGEKGTSFSLVGKRRRDDDRIPPSTGTGTGTAPRDQQRRPDSYAFAMDVGGDTVLERESQLLEEEIMCHFGPGSDLWRPWSGRRTAANGSSAGSSSSSSRKRSASSEENPGSTGLFERHGEAERRTKALKSELGAAAGGPVANGGGGFGLGALVGRHGSSHQQIPSQHVLSQQQAVSVSERAAGRAAAEQLPPSQPSQRVPGARTLAPFLQALTASQQMKVSHEVCRVMTAGVKEYLRRIIEACLVSARAGGAGEGRQLGSNAVAGGLPGPVGTKGTPLAGSPSNHSNGTPAVAAVPASGVKGQTSSVAAVASGVAGATPLPIISAVPSTNGGGNSSAPRAALPAPAAPSGGGHGGILTPGHLQTALETTPRLVGPPSSSRAQWRRVATYAGEHLAGNRGLARLGPAL
eukprot:g6050.t1